FRVRTRQGEIISMADAGRLDFDQHFAGLGAFEINLDDFERLTSLKGYGGAGLHLQVSDSSNLPDPRIEIANGQCDQTYNDTTTLTVAATITVLKKNEKMPCSNTSRCISREVTFTSATCA